MDEGYDTAQICMNGHVVAATAGSSPQFRKSFCKKCGAATTMECLECLSVIQGHYHVPGVIGFMDYDPPLYCHNCGKPFPWTTRTIDAVAQLASGDGSLTRDETVEFREDLREIIRESPQARASANRMKEILGKLKAGTATAIRDMLVDIASESVKKMIWP